MRVNGELGVARYSISGGGAELDLSPILLQNKIVILTQTQALANP